MIENPLLYGIVGFCCAGFILSNLAVLLMCILRSNTKREAAAVRSWLRKVKEAEDEQAE